MNTYPLLGHTELDAVLCYRGSTTVTARVFLQEAQALATHLHATDGEWIINLCQDRYHFLLGFAAVLLAGKTNLLPANDAAETLNQLHQQFPGAVSLHDRTAWPHPHAAIAWPQHPLDAPAVDTPPTIPADHLAAWVFTSGSTGQPVGHRKTWGKLWQNITAGRAALGLDQPHQLLGTVPPQHMYGFESLVLLCLIGTCPLWCGRPFYPADIIAALEALPPPRLLVTTPYHLQTLLDAALPLPAVNQLLLATAPLEPALARRAEQSFNAPLLEIYGSTETGQMATRRPSQSDVWHLFPGVQLTPNALDDPSLFRAEGGHIEQPVALSDHLECLPDGRFRLQGRVADQVNLAGKRSALSHLSAQLKAIPGVVDAVFFQPDSNDQRGARLCALAVAPEQPPETLLAALRDRIDPVFLPRPLILVDALPYNATGKLPKAALLDHLTDYRIASASATARLTLPADTPLFSGHFPGNPIVPGALLLDWLLGEVQHAMRCDRAALCLEQAKFVSPVRPDETVRFTLSRQASDRWRFTVQAAARTVVTGSLRQTAK